MMIRLYQFEKNFLIVFFLMVSLILSAGGVTISKGRIMMSHLFSSIPADGGAYCEFELKNETEHDVMITVSFCSERNAGTEREFVSDFFAPAKTVQICHFPVRMDGSREYTIKEITGKAVVIDNSIRTFALSSKKEILPVITDDIETPLRTLTSLSVFSGQVASTLMSSRSVPFDSVVLENASALLISHSNFKDWYAQSFDSVVEYVKNGGTLVFLSPDDVYAAMDTPLRELLPIENTSKGFYSASVYAAFCKYEPRYAKAIDIGRFPVAKFRLKENAEVLSELEGFPLFAQCSFEKGKVRTAAVDMTESKFLCQREAWGCLLQKLCEGKRIPPREIVYTRNTLNLPEGSFFELPHGNALFNTFFAIVVILVAGSIIGLFVKKAYIRWLIQTLLVAIIVLLSCIHGGKLFSFFHSEKIFPNERSR